MIEKSLESAPPSRYGERAPCCDIFGQARIECAQARSKHPAVGLREEHSYPAAETRELISMGACNFHNQPLALEPAQIIGGLTCGIGHYPKRTNAVHHLTITETC